MDRMNGRGRIVVDLRDYHNRLYTVFRKDEMTELFPINTIDTLIENAILSLTEGVNIISLVYESSLSPALSWEVIVILNDMLTEINSYLSASKMELGSSIFNKTRYIVNLYKKE